MKKLILFLIFLLVSNVFSQFGQNKVQYRTFSWSFIQSKHFDVYYYENGKDLAEFAAVAAESAYVSISKTFNYQITKRIPIVVYNSHNEFQQTNVSLEYLEEGIGGFTEIFKNRVVLPYEGSYEGFRHVLHHELVHAVVNDLFFGGNAQSIVTGAYTNLPLWWNEGLAEFESLDWDTQTDLYLRDAVINNYLPPVEYLYGFMAYRGGQSIWKFIAEKYGREKIAEIIAKTRLTKSIEGGFKSATGLDIKTLDEQWSKNLKKIYWPEVTDRLEPTDFAKKLTDHKKEEGHYNLAPVFSPDGTKIALLTSRNDYADVYLISAIDGRTLKKLVSGSKTESLEELHWLSPGMDWSPDGTKIVFSSKSGNSDALQFVNTKNGKITQTDFKDTKLDGIFTTKWSFDGKEIGFIGNYKGASDVYVYNLETKKLENLTNDFFSDSEPAFSPDGKLIAFVSDRGENGIGNKEIYAEKMFQHDFYQKDLYIFNRETKQLKRLTKTKWAEDHPVFSPDGKFLAFTSEKNGISNIFLMDLEKESEPYPITNALTGCYQIDWSNDGNKMAFTSLFNGGWDIFVISNPKNIAPDSIKLKDTFYLNLQKEKVVTKKETTQKNVVDTTKAKESEITAQDFRSYVFAKGYSEKSEKKKEDDYKPVVVLSDSLTKNEQGDYNVNRYRLKFTPDYTGGAFGYDTFNGLQGQVAFSFSDIMGDHNFGVGIGFFVSLQNSNYVFSYAYLPKRTDWLGQVYHYADFYRIGLSTTKGDEEAIVRLRQIGLDVVGSYPISKFRRIDFGLDFRNQRRELISKLEGEVYQEDQHLVKRSTKVAIPNVSYVRDSTLPWYTGPVDGWRYSLNYLGSPKFSGNSMDFHTFTFDTRHYFRVTKQNSFAFRLSGGRSFGPNKQHFFLGGIKYWFNPGFDNVETGGKLDKLLSQEEEFFPYFITSIRGADYYQGIGKQFFVLNSEFRHILIKRFDMGFPPFSFPPVFGAIFMDSGAAWDGKFDLHRTSVKSEFGEPAGTRFFNDLIMTYGLSTSIPLGFLFFKIDVAWLYDGYKSHKPQWLFSLGTFGDEF